VTGDEVDRLLWTLHERDAMWAGDQVGSKRWEARADVWRTTLANARLEDVKRAVQMLRDGGRISSIKVAWLLDQCQVAARHRAIEAGTPRADCADCQRLGAGRICQHHRDVGMSAIERIRQDHGWTRPATVETDA
jgi:hypothetical protein